jgi:uncharacterized protein (DUF885 family)
VPVSSPVRAFIVGLACALTVACTGRSSESPAASTAPAAAAGLDARVRTLADTYLNAYFERNPEWGTVYGVPGRHHDRLFDNSLDAQRQWEQKEDAFLADARGIDAATVGDPRLRATYAIVRESLESSIAMRSCRPELWNVSQMNGWHTNLGYVVTIQPVGSDAARREAMARWSLLPKYIDTEIANLREGMRLGYTAPKVNVRIVIDQIRTLVDSPITDSPFDSPAERDDSPQFKRQYEALVSGGINAAARRYLTFLRREYLPAARDAIGVSAIPNGAVCYESSIRSFSSLPKSAKEVHETGLAQMEQLTAEMQAIGEKSFGTGDVPALLQRVRTGKPYLFKSRADLIAYSKAALDRARAAAPMWFGLIPKAEVRLEPYPAYREKSGPNEYNPPAEDGSHPGLFYVSAYQAEKKSRVTTESTAFHETIPGHHMQVALALERKEIHPIGRYIYNSGYVEGWGLYAERLADEMHLYSSDLDRLGMVSSQAFRAARLVVDTGIHSMGWTRAQAIDYMLTHTAEPADSIAAEVDRYIILPGQATAYMLGMLEIRGARDDAEKRMGSRLDIRAFHDRVLEDGAVPLTFLRQKIATWSATGSAE